MIIIDAHNDTLERRLGRGDTLDLTVDMPPLDTDLARLKAGGITAQFQQVGIESLVKGLQLLDAAHTLCTTYPQHFRWISTVSDIVEAHSSGQVGLVGQMESCSCLGGELFLLRTMRRLGVTVAGLTHGEAPEHGLQAEVSPKGPCTAEERETARREGRRLTSLGREAIAELNHLRMLVDLAHCNDSAFYEALELSATTPIFSHGNAFAQCPQWRNLTDDQIRALAQRGGVMGVACYRRFIDAERPSVARLVDHIEHIVGLVGIEHVGLGADWDGLGEAHVAIPQDPAHLGEIVAEMELRGFEAGEIAAFLGGNWMRVYGEVVG